MVKWAAVVLGSGGQQQLLFDRSDMGCKSMLWSICGSVMKRLVLASKYTVITGDRNFGPC
jgi:hypothetical protein